MAQRSHDLQAISDRALSHLDLDSLLHEILGRVRGRLRADTATILLLTESGEEIVLDQ